MENYELKKVLGIFSVAVLAISLISAVAIFQDSPSQAGVTPETETPVQDDDYFYSESDGRMIEKGPFWHPQGSEDHFSVRYAGFSSDVPDNVKDIYLCVNDIKKTQTISLDLQMYNHENRELWFTIQDNGTGATNLDVGGLTDKEMGSVAGNGGKDSSWTYSLTLDNIDDGSGFTGEVTETIDLRVSSWEDSGYTTLYTRDNFDVDIHLIDRKDTSYWNVVNYENFEDQSTDDWLPYKLWDADGDNPIDYDQEPISNFGISTDVYRSSEYSFVVGDTSSVSGTVRGNLGVSNTPAYMIIPWYVNSGAFKDASAGDSLPLGEGVRLVKNLTQGKDRLKGMVGFSAPIEEEWRQSIIPLDTDDTNAGIIGWGDHNDSQQDRAWIDDVYIIEKAP